MPRIQRTHTSTSSTAMSTILQREMITAMRLLRWKVALPLLQLALAVCLWLYMPFQFSREMVALMRLIPEQVVGRGLDLSVETIHLYSPPLAGRLLYAMNFPAYVLSNKVEDLVMWRTTPAFPFTIE